MSTEKLLHKYKNEVRPAWAIEISRLDSQVGGRSLCYNNDVADNIDILRYEFCKLLVEMRAVASRLGEGGFVQCISHGIDLLINDKCGLGTFGNGSVFNGLRPSAASLWSAVLSTNFFGGMGSWNDGPANYDLEAQRLSKVWHSFVEGALPSISYVSRVQPGGRVH